MRRTYRIEFEVKRGDGRQLWAWREATTKAEAMGSARGLLASLRVDRGLRTARVWLDGHAVRARKEDLKKEVDCGQEGLEEEEEGGAPEVSVMRESPTVPATGWLFAL